MPKRPSAASAAASHPLISNERLQHLYITLLECRALHQYRRGRQRRAPLVAPEAIVTGTVTHLEDGDTLMPLPGDHLAALVRGHALRRLFAGGQLPGILPAGSTAAERFTLATGFALAHRGEKQIALAFSGPGIDSLDALKPSLAYAAEHKLGVIFVIETAADADVSSARYTEKLGLPGIPVDADDVIAIYRVTQEAITRARRSGGPTLIDCKPWPLGKAIDPVRKLEETLERCGILNPKTRPRVLAAFQARLRAAKTL